jgi:hypothetical protein
VGVKGVSERGNRLALTPIPSPTLWERGELHADLFGVLKR